MAGIDNNTLLYLRGDSFKDLSPSPKVINNQGCVLGDGFINVNSKRLEVNNINIGSGDFTLEFYVFLKNTSSVNQTFFTTEQDDWKDLYIVANGVENFRSAYAGVDFGVLSQKISVGKWTHIAMCRKGTDLSVFIDGLLKSKNTLSSTASCNMKSLVVGHHKNYTNEVFSGYLKNIRMSNISRYTEDFFPTASIYSSISIDVANQTPTNIDFSVIKLGQETINKVDVLINNVVSKTYIDNYDNISYEIDKELTGVGNNKIQIRVSFDNVYTEEKTLIHSTKIDRLPSTASLKQVVDTVELIADANKLEYDVLKSNLENKGVEVSEEDKMLDLINKIDLFKPYIPVYGVRVDESNSNPATSVTYIGDGVGVTPAAPTGYGGWANKYPFNEIKPCGFKAGKVFKYINPNDFTKYEDGTTVEADVDVMIEFPKLYWKFTTVANGYEIRIAKTKLDDGFLCPAHTIGTREVDKIYIGAYLGQNVSGKLRSIRDVLPTANQTIGTFRTQAQANGSGYQQYNYYSMFMLQILYLIMYKNLDSQTALGCGFANGNPASIKTGGTATKGMIFGETGGKLQMKFLGVEDFWGNLRQWTDGYFFNSNRKMMISNNSVFNDNGTGYEDCGQGNTANTSGYFKSCQGGTKTGFVIKETGGSTTTYYNDHGSLHAGCLPAAGGTWSSGLYAGAFFFNAYCSASDTNSSLGSRLVYLG